jgi:hypothetical protein
MANLQAYLGETGQPTLPVLNRIKSILIQVLRGVPFVLGYLKGKSKDDTVQGQSKQLKLLYPH